MPTTTATAAQQWAAVVFSPPLRYRAAGALAAAQPAAQHRTLHQFYGDCTHEYVLEEWPRWARPFVMGSVGATHISGASSRFTRFSFGRGGGIKLYANRHLGLRVQGEWLPVVINPEVRGFICGAVCIVHLTATPVSQGEVTVGPIFRF